MSFTVGAWRARCRHGCRHGCCPISEWLTFGEAPIERCRGDTDVSPPRRCRGTAAAPPSGPAIIESGVAAAVHPATSSVAARRERPRGGSRGTALSLDAKGHHGSLRVTKGHQGSPRDTKVHQGSPRLANGGQRWPRVANGGQGWPRVVKCHQGSPRVAKDHQAWPRVAKGGPKQARNPANTVRGNERPRRLLPGEPAAGRSHDWHRATSTSEWHSDTAT